MELELSSISDFQKSGDHSNHIGAMLEDKEWDISNVVISLFFEPMTGCPNLIQPE